MKTLYEILEVNKDDELLQFKIKQQYYKLSKIYHPDRKETGDALKFREIKAAYDILKDPESRKFYDETGLMLEGGSVQLKTEAVNILNNFINQWIDASLNNQSVPELNQFLTEACYHNIREVEQKINLHSTVIKKLESMLTDITYSGNEKNISEQIIESKLSNAKGQLNLEMQRLESLKICLKISSKYRSTPKQQNTQIFTNNFGQQFYKTTTHTGGF